MAHVDKSCTGIDYSSAVPGEVLSHIFVLGSNRPVRLFYRRNPPQVTISQVCSRWRQIALTTGSLWSSVSIPWFDFQYARLLSVYQIWVGRAGKYPLTIRLSYYNECPDIYNIIRDFVVPFRIKMLRVVLSYNALLNLPPLDVEEFDITVPKLGRKRDFKVPPFMDRIRHLHLFDLETIQTSRLASAADFKGLCWSWSQLHSFECHLRAVTLTTWFDVLQAQPLQSLEYCSLAISNIGSGPLVGVSMPSLRRFTLQLELHAHPDFVIPLIATPNITGLEIYSRDNWSSDTYDIMTKHYKLHQLQQLGLHAAQFPLPVARILADAPMIHSLAVMGKPVLEAEGREGIASGRLGRCLTVVHLDGRFDSAGEWFDVIETRQRNLNLMVTQVSNWRQMFTRIKSVEIWDMLNFKIKDREEWVETLMALGISVPHHLEPVSCVSVLKEADLTPSIERYG